MMTPAEIRLKQNPILSSLLLGMGQGTFIAEKLDISRYTVYNYIKANAHDEQNK